MSHRWLTVFFIRENNKKKSFFFSFFRCSGCRIFPLLYPKCFPLVIRRTENVLSTIVVLWLPGKQKTQGSIACKSGRVIFCSFCCHSITLIHPVIKPSSTPSSLVFESFIILSSASCWNNQDKSIYYSKQPAHHLRSDDQQVSASHGLLIVVLGQILCFQMAY